MNCAFAAALLALALIPFAAAQTASSKTTKSPAKSSKTASTHRKSRRAAPRPSYQAHPDAERYQQIQQALAQRGYFKGQVNGQWGADSVDALKRFQADQKLDNDGKINAQTLIGLGLGPKHEGAPVTPAAPSSSNPVDVSHPNPAGSPSPEKPVQTAPPAPPSR